MNDTLHGRRELHPLRRILAGRILAAAAALCAGCVHQTGGTTPEAPPAPAVAAPQPAPAPVRRGSTTKTPQKPASPQAPAGVSDPERIPILSVLFELQSERIDPRFVAELRSLADDMKADQRLWVILEGHADARGSREFNVALAQRRAAEVQRHLVELGVKPARIRVHSYGEERGGDDRHAHRVDVLLRRSER